MFVMVYILVLGQIMFQAASKDMALGTGGVEMVMFILILMARLKAPEAIEYANKTQVRNFFNSKYVKFEFFDALL